MSSINKLMEKMMSIEGFESLTKHDVKPISKLIKETISKKQQQ